MNRLVRTIDTLNDRIGRAVSWLALVLVVVGGWNAIARYLDRETGTVLSSNFWIEAGWYLFALLLLFGAAWVLRNDAHVRVDVFYSRLSDRGKAWIDMIGSFVLLIPFSLLMLWAVWPSVVESWRISEMSPDPGGLPRWPIRAVVPIAIVLLMLQGLSNGLKALSLLRGTMPTGEEEERND